MALMDTHTSTSASCAFKRAGPRLHYESSSEALAVQVGLAVVREILLY